MNTANPIGLKGIEFVEFCSPDAETLEKLFFAFGFSKLATTTNKEQRYFKQNDINFIISMKKNGHAYNFSKTHGPSICSMAFRVDNAQLAHKEALLRGAKNATGEYAPNGEALMAIYGIGDSLIYFVDQFNQQNFYRDLGFLDNTEEKIIPSLGFKNIDHLMNFWSDFYKNIFGFTEVRYFDIKGAKTGLVSYALKSPCSTFCIPINEGTEKKSQINEYLDEYNGPGIQHLAFTTEDIIQSVQLIQKAGVKTLNMDEEYYAEVFQRVPNVTENKEALKKYQILVDGDEHGYLLQIFTKNIIGPIFIEIIQRKNHHSFGEGNFGALFRSIEKDQEERGYL
jgi:4-hydroxyphenylpyruvate dioxygenase